MTDRRESLENIGESVSEALLSRAGRVSSRVHESRGIDADVLESDEAYLVVFDAPGAQPSDVQVRYVDGAVHVRIDRFRDYFEGFDMLFPGRGLSLDGKAELPPDARVDAGAARATLSDRGTLEIRIPRKEPREGEEIDVTGDKESDGDAAEGTDEEDVEGTDEDEEDAADEADGDDGEGSGDDGE